VKDLKREQMEMQEKLAENQKVGSEMHMLVGQLCAALSVDSTEADLAQRLKSLVVPLGTPAAA
jgi:hypothetical protein